METREKDIESILVREVENCGGMCLKLNSLSMAGLPDRLVLMPRGLICFVELKAKKKKLRKLQEYVRNKLEQLGYKVYVVDSVEKAKACVSSYRMAIEWWEGENL